MQKRLIEKEVAADELQSDDVKFVIKGDAGAMFKILRRHGALISEDTRARLFEGEGFAVRRLVGKA